MNLYCDHFGKDILHEIIKWHSCPIRSMCAGCWFLVDLDEEDLCDCDAPYTEVFYDYDSPMRVQIECPNLKAHDRCDYDKHCDFKEVRKNKK